MKKDGAMLTRIQALRNRITRIRNQLVARGRYQIYRIRCRNSSFFDYLTRILYFHETIELERNINAYYFYLLTVCFTQNMLHNKIRN